MEHDITVFLDDWGRGDHSALDRLAPLVYPQLRGRWRGNRCNHFVAKPSGQLPAHQISVALDSHTEPTSTNPATPT